MYNRYVQQKLPTSPASSRHQRSQPKTVSGTQHKTEAVFPAASERRSGSVISDFLGKLMPKEMEKGDLLLMLILILIFIEDGEDTDALIILAIIFFLDI